MPSLDDHESRLRRLEEWRYEIAAPSVAVVKRTVELLDRVESRVEHLEWRQEQSAASVTKRQAIYAAVVLAVVSPTVATLIAHFVK